MMKKLTLRNVAVLCLAMGAIFVSGSSAPGFSYFQYGGMNVVFVPAEDVRYLYPSTFQEGGDPDTLYLAAMGLWGLTPACDFQYSYSRLDQDQQVDHTDGYSDTLAVAAASFDPGVLAETYMVNLGEQWYDMDMLISDFPANVGWNMIPDPDCEVVGDPQSFGYSFYLVVTHELGHALGLGHDPIGNEPPGSSWFIATMNPRYPTGGPIGQEGIVELHTDDQSGARFLYPHSGPADPPLVDLASASTTTGSLLGQAVPLYYEPTAVAPEGIITAMSVIENFGTTNEFSVSQGFYLSIDNVIDTEDILLGELLWDIAFDDAFEFGVDIDMPEDIAAGEYYLGSILDNTNLIDEEYEDNNAAIYCQPLTVLQLAPAMENLGEHIASCGQPYTGPTPVVSHPLNMAPITWSIDNPPQGMLIDPATGIVNWESPIRSEFLYVIYVRATNDAGTTVEELYLGVTEAQPVVIPPENGWASCLDSYTSPAPTVSQPECMNPIINWSLDSGPAGMTINHDTGAVTWPVPIPSDEPYPITIRATNSVGNGTAVWYLTVSGTSDMDGDLEVDLEDYDLFSSCMSGPDDTIDAGCACGDIDGDGDVDMMDYVEFTLVYDGPSPFVGACCLDDGSCFEGSPGDCTAAEGTYMGFESTCGGVTCTGACCFYATGGCLDISADFCETAGGEFQGAGSLCSATDCTPTGACCLADESCIIATEDDCTVESGIYMGDLTECGEVDCSFEPIGACCHSDESCTESTEAECVTLAGTYQGDDTTCATTDCTITLVGACCDPIDWTCTEVSQADCEAIAGTYEGDDTTCASTSCPEYRNDIPTPTTIYSPGIGSELADDLTLAGSDRDLIYYDLYVYGGDAGGGPFGVTASLYDGCPGEGGSLIAGTTASWSSIPDDAQVYTLSADFIDGTIPIPTTVWMVVSFTTNQAGWVLAETAEVGATADVFGQDDGPPNGWGCAFNFTTGGYAGFWTNIQCVDDGGRSSGSHAGPKTSYSVTNLAGEILQSQIVRMEE